MSGLDALRPVADLAGLTLSAEQEEQLRAFADWLIEEAIPAGGLGPREGPRIWGRHLADSLSFAVAWRDRPPPRELLDVGTGVGLPGIPLAIAFPQCRVTLLDRSGRRIRLLRRIVRILALDRVVIEQADAFAVADEWENLTFRGAVPIAEAVGLTNGLLAPGGTSVFGVSRRAERPPRIDEMMDVAGIFGLTSELLSLPAEMLDGPSWLLIMRRGESS